MFRAGRVFRALGSVRLLRFRLLLRFLLFRFRAVLLNEPHNNCRHWVALVDGVVLQPEM